jgi:hypothetical protein
MTQSKGKAIGEWKNHKNDRNKQSGLEAAIKAIPRKKRKK